MKIIKLQNFLIHPYKLSKKNSNRILLTAASVLFAIATLGMVHLAVLCLRGRVKKNPKLPQQERVGHTASRQRVIKRPDINAPILKDLINLQGPIEKRARTERKGPGMGGTCYFNSALHLIAHLPCLRKYFDKSFLLEKRQEESEEDYAARQEIQSHVSQMLFELLSGKHPVKGTSQLITLMNRISEKPFSEEGGCSEMVISFLLKLISGKEEGDLFMIGAPEFNNIPSLAAYLQDEKHPEWLEVPMGIGYPTPLEFEAKPYSYRLEAADAGTEGHSIPLIHAGEKEYLLFDDVNTALIQMSEEETADYLQNFKISRMYYKRFLSTD